MPARHSIHVWALVLLVGSTLAFADDPTPPESLPMPESPAAAAIGTADATILKPSTAKDLAASLVRVASRGGKITSGISLEFAPMVLFTGSRYIAGYSTGINVPESLPNHPTTRYSPSTSALTPAWLLATPTLSPHTT